MVVLTDDQDVDMDSMQAMPQTRRLLVECASCLNFTAAYVATPICCPSRSSYLSGLHTHNHRTLNNNVPHGCDDSHWKAAVERFAYPAMLQQVGYRSAFFGKYLNTFGSGLDHGRVPAGWNRFFGLVGNSRFYDYQIVQEDGSVTAFGHNYSAGDYLTDKIRQQALSFLDTHLAVGGSAPNSSASPLLLVLHPPAPHRPCAAAPQYQELFAGAQSPRTPNWNNKTATLDKHEFLHSNPAMDDVRTAYSDLVFRRRLQSLVSVDDMVAAVVGRLQDLGQLDNTIVLYTSDHGYHCGQFTVDYCKMLPYQSDVHIPLFVRMPGSTASGPLAVAEPVLNVDLAPTLCALGGCAPQAPAAMPWDGRAYLPRFINTTSATSATTVTTVTTPSQPPRSSWLIEYWPIVEAGLDVQTQPHNMFQNPPQWTGPTYSTTVDAGNNTWACVRTLIVSASGPRDAAADWPAGALGGHVNTIFCRFWPGYAGRAEGDTAANFYEFYDLDSDPFQLVNAVKTLSPTRRAAYEALLTRLEDCRGDDCYVS